ncbi:hypothetical protein GGI21_005806, partial [Coemansia aciculifera]
MGLWIYATVLMRRVNVCFNEYRELLVVIITTVCIVILQVVLRWIPAIGDTGFAYNTMASMSDVLIGQTSLFLLVYKPAYHCLVNKDDYLKYFLRTLKRENRQTEYELANGEELARISSSFFGSRSANASGRKSHSGFALTSRLYHKSTGGADVREGGTSIKGFARALYADSQLQSDTDSDFRDVVVHADGPDRMLV